MVNLERIYHNHDRSPSVSCEVGIKIQIDINDGNGFVDTPFLRYSLISAATANDEPAILSFSTNFILDVPIAGSKFRILVMGTEGGVDNSDLHLLKMKTVSHVISAIPT